MRMPETPILIVAAGASRRLGTPKQLVPWRGKPLLQHGIDEALAANVGRVHLVLGAAAAEIEAQLDVSRICVHRFAGWAAGMGASIAFGVAAVMAHEAAGGHSPKGQRAEREASPVALIVAVGDQPHLTAAHLRALHSAKAPVVVSRYAEGMGPPTRFGRAVWPALCALSGDEGARDIVAAYRKRGEVEAIDFAAGNIDIDTPEDVQRYLR